MRSFAAIATLWAALGLAAAQQLRSSDDGQCGPGTFQTCIGSADGDCCSEHGWCGGSSEHCDVGCQLGYGYCNPGVAGNTTDPSPTRGPPGQLPPPPTASPEPPFEPPFEPPSVSVIFVTATISRTIVQTQISTRVVPQTSITYVAQTVSVTRFTTKTTTAVSSKPGLLLIIKKIEGGKGERERKRRRELLKRTK
jgi:hypothetical protein